MKLRFLNILVALDQFLFVLLTLGTGYPNESFSSAAWRGEADGRIMGRIFRPVIDTLLWFDPAHCATAYWNVIYGRQLPPSYTRGFQHDKRQ